MQGASAPCIFLATNTTSLSQIIRLTYCHSKLFRVTIQTLICINQETDLGQCTYQQMLENAYWAGQPSVSMSFSLC